MKIMCTSTDALLKACMVQFLALKLTPPRKEVFTAQLPSGDLSNVKTLKCVRFCCILVEKGRGVGI